MTRAKHFLTGLLLATLVVLHWEPVSANTKIHNQVRESLVKLVAKGTARIGPSTGTIVETVGTGFFVGTDGYILTTAHLFDKLKEANAMGTTISGGIVGGRDVKVLYVSELSSLDLVLLRAIIPFGVATPPSLTVGHSSDVNPDEDDVEFLTSGYDETGYRKKGLTFNDRSNAIANFAWTLDGKTNSGQSGSPVYVDQRDKPLVVGVLKATSRVDDELSLMIPIENSFQLIGQFKMQEMQRKIDELELVLSRVQQLETLLGELPTDKPPLGNRVGSMESSVEQVKSNFDWSAVSDARDGSIIVTYEKIIGDGPQIEEILVKIKPFMYFKNPDDGTKSSEPLRSLRRITEKRHKLDPNGRVGSFVLSGVQDTLTDLVENYDDTFKDQEPFRELQISLKAKIEGVPNAEVLETLTMVPRFNWEYEDQ
ncbi:MAG: serine protease [Pseudomonadota bacterium]